MIIQQNIFWFQIPANENDHISQSIKTWEMHVLLKLAHFSPAK
jgi:hypothetical protein